MKRLALVAAVAAAVVGGLPGPLAASAATLPATVTGGSGVVSMTDNCGGNDNLPNMGKWVDTMTLDFAVRVDGRQRYVKLATSYVPPPPDFNYFPGERGISCSSSVLPTMSFTGSSEVGASLAFEPVTGWCQDSARIQDFSCTLSFSGAPSVTLTMNLEDVYDDCNSGGGPSEYCDRYQSVVGAQHLVP